jgi:RluA family pseudouridine synthase
MNQLYAKVTATVRSAAKMKIPVLKTLENEIFFVDKPSGISVHNDPGKDILSLLERQLQKKVYLVHRLDQETSGLLCVSTSPALAAEMTALFQGRQIQKFYFGICRGLLKEKNGRWTQSLTDKAEGRKNPQGISKDRVEAETGFQVLSESNFISLVKFELFSGRQHQIRKHCALARHALVNDSRYGDSAYNEKMQEVYKVERMLLHSAKLIFNWKNETIEVSAPLPPEFDSSLWQLQYLQK